MIKEDVLKKREMEAHRADSERIDALEDLERQRHEEAELVRVKAKQASLLMAVTPKPGPGAMPFSGSSSKDSGIGSQSSNSQFVRGPHAADSDIPPDARHDGASALQCGVYGTAFGVPRIPGPQRDYDGIISPVVCPGHAPGDQGRCPQEAGNGGA